jgi:cell division protease FtsH
MQTHLDLVKSLVTTMAGAASEMYVFGMLSTGVENDLEHATKIAHSMCAIYGMSPAIGPVTIGEKPGEVFIGRDLANMGNVAAESLSLVDRETRRMVHEAEDLAQKIIAANAAVLEDLANSLLRSETLSGPSLDVYMDAVRPWREPLLKDAADHASPIEMAEDALAAHPDHRHHDDER